MPARSYSCKWVKELESIAVPLFVNRETAMLSRKGILNLKDNYFWLPKYTRIHSSVIEKYSANTLSRGYRTIQGLSHYEHGSHTLGAKVTKDEVKHARRVKSAAS